jgi:uncharacterized protein (DUF2225 family)
MVTTQKITLRCPVCEKSFESDWITSENLVPQTRRTDFHPYLADNKCGLPFQIHTCHGCGYTKSIEGFVEQPQEYANTGLITFLQYKVYPHLNWLGTGITASAKYEASAKILQYEKAHHKAIASNFLMAAWCCVDEGDYEAERYFRRLAVEQYHDALASFDEVSSDELPVITYLVGELYRRIGNRNQALVWFNKVLRLAPGLSKEKEWLIPLCCQQIKNPEEWLEERS